MPAVALAVLVRLVQAGLVLAGLVQAGLVLAELVLVGLVQAGLVQAGLVLAELVLVELVLAGLVLVELVLAVPVFGTRIGESTGTVTLNLSSLNDGPITLQVTASEAGRVAASVTRVITKDTVAPTLALARTTSDPVYPGNTVGLRVTASEVITELVVSDLTVTNGSLSNFTGSGRNYTADLTVADTGAPFTATVQVPADRFRDVARNPNTAAASLNIAVVARPARPTTATPRHHRASR